MGFFLVMKAELVRSFIIMRRYWFRTIMGMFIGYGMMLMLVWGFWSNQSKMQEGMQMLDDPTGATNYVLGFIIGMFAFGVVGMFTQGLQGMARTGVLEQLCMSPHGLITNFLARTAVASFSTIVTSAIMVWMVTYTLSGQLYFDPLPVFILLTLTFFNLLGFGFMVGGLVLVFKQVGQVAILVRMGLFGLAIFADEKLLQHGVIMSSFMHALPITDASICLKYVLIQDQGRVAGTFSSVFSHPSFLWLLVSCVIWTVLGMLVFRFMEDHSRTKGTLGAY